MACNEMAVLHTRDKIKVIVGDFPQIRDVSKQFSTKLKVELLYLIFYNECNRFNFDNGLTNTI